MKKILLSCVKWLCFTGILTTADIGTVAAWDPKARKSFDHVAADLRFLWHILIFLVIQTSQTAFTFLRAVDVPEMIQSLYRVIAAQGIIIQFLVLVNHSKDITQLLADMQRFVNLKYTSNKQNNITNIAEPKLTFTCKVMERLLLVCWLLYIMEPAILEFQAARTGTKSNVNPDVGFFNDLYFFNASKSPMREICYITMAVGYFSMHILFLTINFFFCGLCIYIVAMYKELEEMLECIDRKANSNVPRRIYNDKTRRSLCGCIQFYLAIISFTEKINNIFSHIIFVQYAYSLFGMCCNIFELFLTSRSNMINVVMTIICYLMGLLTYCWFGQRILDQAVHLQTTIYGLRWYEYNISEQKMIKLMLLRVQKPRGLAAYNYFACDLPTFFNIMSNVYSFVAFLQSMV